MNVKNVVLGIGIVVIYALALWQGIQAFYPTPEWNDFCENDIGIKSYPVGSENCTYPSDLQAKELACSEAGGWFRYEYSNNGCITGGYCDECQINYDDASDTYSRNVFIISLVIGLVTMIIGFFVLSIEPVGSALIGSGIWAIFFGTVVNWRNFGNYVRFGLLLAVLVLLIWFALRLNSHKKEHGHYKLWKK